MSLSAAPYRIIDPHVHVWKHDHQFPFAPEAKNVPAVDRTPETLLNLMRENGVEKTVIIQVIHYRYDNGYLASVLKQYPQYFRGVARVDPLSPAAPITSPSSPRRAFTVSASAPPLTNPATGSKAISCRPCGSAARNCACR